MKIKKHIKVLLEEGKVDEAIKFLEEIQEEDPSLSFGYLAVIYDEGLNGKKDAEKADFFYSKAVEYNNPVTLFNYANFNFDLGNDKKYFQLLKHSAYLGNIEAQNDLGKAYEIGIGCQRNHKKSLEWYTKSAAEGDQLGMYNLGRCFLFGIGISMDEAHGFELINKSGFKVDSDL